MRELRIYQTPDDYDVLIYDDDYDVLIYDQDKDGSSEEAMWMLDKILFDLKPGDVLKIFCVR